MDSGKTWEQVNEILRVLKIACRFLDFPADARVRQFLVERTENGDDSPKDGEENELSDTSAGGGGKRKHLTIDIEAVDRTPVDQEQPDEANEAGSADLGTPAEVSETEATAAKDADTPAH